MSSPNLGALSGSAKIDSLLVPQEHRGQDLTKISNGQAILSRCEVLKKQPHLVSLIESLYGAYQIGKEAPKALLLRAWEVKKDEESYLGTVFQAHFGSWKKLYLEQQKEMDKWKNVLGDETFHQVIPPDEQHIPLSPEKWATKQKQLFEAGIAPIRKDLSRSEFDSYFAGLPTVENLQKVQSVVHFAAWVQEQFARTFPDVQISKPLLKRLQKAQELSWTDRLEIVKEIRDGVGRALEFRTLIQKEFKEQAGEALKMAEKCFPANYQGLCLESEEQRRFVVAELHNLLSVQECIRMEPALHELELLRAQKPSSLFHLEKAIRFQCLLEKDIAQILKRDQWEQRLAALISEAKFLQAILERSKELPLSGGQWEKLARSFPETLPQWKAGMNPLTYRDAVEQQLVRTNLLAKQLTKKLQKSVASSAAIDGVLKPLNSAPSKYTKHTILDLETQIHRLREQIENLTSEEDNETLIQPLQEEIRDIERVIQKKQEETLFETAEEKESPGSHKPSSGLRSSFSLYDVVPIGDVFSKTGQWAVLDYSALSEKEMAQIKAGLKPEQIAGFLKGKKTGEAVYLILNGQGQVEVSLQAKKPKKCAVLFTEDCSQLFTHAENRDLGQRSRLSAGDDGLYARKMKEAKDTRGKWTQERERTAAVDRLQILHTSVALMERILKGEAREIDEGSIQHFLEYAQSIAGYDLASLEGSFAHDSAFNHSIHLLSKSCEQLQPIAVEMSGVHFLEEMNQKVLGNNNSATAVVKLSEAVKSYRGWIESIETFLLKTPEALLPYYRERLIQLLDHLKQIYDEFPVEMRQIAGHKDLTPFKIQASYSEETQEDLIKNTAPVLINALKVLKSATWELAVLENSGSIKQIRSEILDKAVEQAKGKEQERLHIARREAQTGAVLSYTYIAPARVLLPFIDAVKEVLGNPDLFLPMVEYREKFAQEVRAIDMLRTGEAKKLAAQDRKTLLSTIFRGHKIS